MGDETRVQVSEVKKGAAAVGGIVERYMIRWLGPLGRKIAESTKAGRIMALIGVVAIVVSLVLIYQNSFFYDTSITKKGLKVLNIRYEMEGYGMPFIAGIALLVIGLIQKKRK